MQHSDLIQIIRRQHLPRLVFPLIMIIVSVVFIISNPFKKALTPHTLDSLDAIDSLYENGEEYIKCTIDKMYYTGYDYVKGSKKKQVYTIPSIMESATTSYIQQAQPIKVLLQ